MKTICDRCNNYAMLPCGTREVCDARRENNTRFTRWIADGYISKRMNGEKKYCKGYKRLPKLK